MCGLFRGLFLGQDRRRCTKSAAASSGASCPAGPLAWGISPVSMNGNMALLQHGILLLLSTFSMPP